MDVFGCVARCDARTGPGPGGRGRRGQPHRRCGGGRDRAVACRIGAARPRRRTGLTAWLSRACRAARGASSQPGSAHRRAWRAALPSPPSPGMGAPGRSRGGAPRAVRATTCRHPARAVMGDFARTSPGEWMRFPGLVWSALVVRAHLPVHGVGGARPQDHQFDVAERVAVGLQEPQVVLRDVLGCPPGVLTGAGCGFRFSMAKFRF